MIKKKELDEIDLVVINESWTEEERKSFSAFLKARKVGLRKKQPSKKTKVKQAFGVFKSKKDADQIIHEIKGSRNFNRTRAKL